MKITQQLLCIIAGVLMAFPADVRAVENLQITVQCPDVVLSWPSMEGEFYIVQHRQTVDTNSAWVTLTNAMPADSGTNWTCFVHSNQMVCSTNSGSGGGGGSSTPPSPLDGMSSGDALTAAKSLPPWEVEGRQPHIWELENRPPYPWEPGAVNISPTKVSALSGGMAGFTDDVETESSEEENGDMDFVRGFYRVVREGVHLWGVTNGIVLTGEVEIPIELGTTNVEKLAVQLFADGIALPVCEVNIPDVGFPVARWNTAFLGNGTYSLHAECSFLGTEDVLVGVTNSVTVTNWVSFNEFQGSFGEQMWVYAEVAITNAVFEIAMYADEDYIGSFYGGTTNGLISFVWPLTGANNEVFTNETFQGEFYIAAAGGNPRANPPALYRWYKEYGLSGDIFTVAWALTKMVPLASRMENLMLTGVINILANPAADDPYQLSPGNSFHGTAFRLTSATKTNLLCYLADPASRNFYFFGHGNATSFGDYHRAMGGWLAQITDQEIRDTLTNRFPYGRNHHAYRFVFLDSCQSANGPLSDAFGIVRRQVHRMYYKDVLKIASRAFVGYLDRNIPLPTQAIHYDYNAEMLGNFFFEWREGADLHGIVARAKQHPNWPLHGSATIWGATNLFRYHQ
jgi:hypothetical protein